ncbi:hypothetical protein F4861DRAFT_236184 [Xylaria intraflava]|nr:hypothetical protein F4861DRAFT_236184 [Xylaria intraflava]
MADELDLWVIWWQVCLCSRVVYGIRWWLVRLVVSKGLLRVGASAVMMSGVWTFAGAGDRRRVPWPVLQGQCSRASARASASAGELQGKHALARQALSSMSNAHCQYTLCTGLVIRPRWLRYLG